MPRHRTCRGVRTLTRCAALPLLSLLCRRARRVRRVQQRRRRQRRASDLVDGDDVTTTTTTIASTTDRRRRLCEPDLANAQGQADADRERPRQPGRVRDRDRATTASTSSSRADGCASSTTAAVAKRRCSRSRSRPATSKACSGSTFSADGTQLYVDYTDPNGDTHVDEYTMNGDVADVASRRRVALRRPAVREPQRRRGHVRPRRHALHHARRRRLRGRPAERAQNLGELLGKILRIDPTPNGNAPYTIPADNPFVGTSGARPEIWMYGLRNPWRFSFDRATRATCGSATSARATWEEVDYTPLATAAGSNWGWNLREGTHEYKGRRTRRRARPDLRAVPRPTATARSSAATCTAARKIPALEARTSFGDYCRAELSASRRTNGALAGEALLGPRDELDHVVR